MKKNGTIGAKNIDAQYENLSLLWKAISPEPVKMITYKGLYDPPFISSYNLKILKNFQKYIFFWIPDIFCSRHGTDLRQYSNSPSWCTDFKNVWNIIVGLGVPVEFWIRKLEKIAFFDIFRFLAQFSSFLNQNLNLNP